MNDTICIATLTGPGVKPLVLDVIKVVLYEDNTFEIKSYWDEGENFFDALHRNYDHLSVAWHNLKDGVATGAVSETTYTAYGGFNITGTLTTEDHLSLSLADITLQPKQAVHARTCPHDWRYSAGAHMKVGASYPYRSCAICDEM